MERSENVYADNMKVPLNYDEKTFSEFKPNLIICAQIEQP